MTAANRLRMDYMRLKKDPVPYIVAEPSRSPVSDRCRLTMRLSYTLSLSFLWTVQPIGLCFLRLMRTEAFCIAQCEVGSRFHN